MQGQTWKVFIKDYYNVLRHLLKERPNSLSALKETVHRFHALDNKVLVGLTRLDRELNRIRYYGIWRYLTNNSLCSGGLGKNAMTENAVVKIPFMITAEQKQYMILHLNFSLEQIKQLTPNEAVRIIENRIYAQDYEPSRERKKDP